MYYCKSAQHQGNRFHIYIYIYGSSPVARGPPPPAVMVSPPVGRPGGWGGRSGWAAGPGGHARPLGPVGGPAGGLSERVDGWALAGGWLVGGRLNRRHQLEGTLSKETFRNSMHQMSVCCMFFVSVWSYVSVQTRRSCLCWLLI